jgi:hypothetical protein
MRKVQAALTFAATTGEWVVVVVHDNVTEVHDLLHVLAGEDARHAGRTVMLPNGGRVTVTSLLHEVHGSNYCVLFMDAEATNTAVAAVHSPPWRKHAKSVLALDEREESLVLT